jgi:hypothetical protein
MQLEVLTEESQNERKSVSYAARMDSAVYAWHWALPDFPSLSVLSVIGPDRTQRRFALEIFVPFILPSRQPTLSRI